MGKKTDQLTENYLKTYGKIQRIKITTSQRNDYSTNCLLDYNYFKNYYKMIPIDLNK